MNINEKNESNKRKKYFYAKNNMYYKDKNKQVNKLNNKEKIFLIEKYFKKIMETLGLNMYDENLKNTPKRISRMYINEIFKGLSPEFRPKISLFKNKYNKMVVEKNIIIHSICEHHFLPIIGKAHVGYISNGKIIGLSKINRIVDYLSRRPQIQERLTIEIVQYLQKILNTKDVSCIIHAKHLCVSFRGIRDYCSNTITSEFGGVFTKKSIQNEFFNYVRLVI